MAMVDMPKQDPWAKVEIEKIYVKDLSFETPSTPHVFHEKLDPVVALQVSSVAKALRNNRHEVVLRLIVTANLKDKTAFLVDVRQAGIFKIDGYDAAQLGTVIGSYCPRLLYPYAREVVSDLVRRGGFPQLLLESVDLDAL
jgi:preprotein translocase subunit SecB